LADSAGRSVWLLVACKSPSAIHSHRHAQAPQPRPPARKQGATRLVAKGSATFTVFPRRKGKSIVLTGRKLRAFTWGTDQAVWDTVPCTGRPSRSITVRCSVHAIPGRVPRAGPDAMPREDHSDT
jgi:hypothetical protein